MTMRGGNPFQMNLQRYRDKAAKQVGGSPHAVMECRQLGYKPPGFAKLIPFDDYAVLDETDPTNPHHGTPSMTVKSVLNSTALSDPAYTYSWELVLKSAEAFRRPLFLAIPWAPPVLALTGSNWASGVEPTLITVAHSLSLEAVLIKQPLDVGETWGLDVLTWDNFARKQAFWTNPANCFIPLRPLFFLASSDGGPCDVPVTISPLAGSPGFTGFGGELNTCMWLAQSVLPPPGHDYLGADDTLFYGVHLRLSYTSAYISGATFQSSAEMAVSEISASLSEYPRAFIIDEQLEIEEFAVVNP